MYLKDLPPVGYDRAYLERELQKIVEAVEVLEDEVTLNRDALKINGIRSTYSWNDALTLTDPGAGGIGGDAIQLNAITILRVSDIDIFGRDLRPIWDRRETIQVGVGELISLFDSSRTINGLYTVAAVAVDQGGWGSLAVTWVAGASGNPQPLDTMTILWKPQAIEDEPF